VRLFFALWPDEETIRHFQAAASGLTIEGRGRLVSPRNLHVTLAFVGEVSDEQVESLQRIGAVMRAPRFVLICDHLEYWPHSRAIVAVLREAPAELLDLSARLQQAIGLRQEPLKAHVTLARKVTQAPVLPALSPLVWRATQFSLIRSQTGGAESSYTVVDTWPLLYEP
jgi:RNA 2',3'-cyclic 3'-phosphodiesterase